MSSRAHHPVNEFSDYILRAALVKSKPTPPTPTKPGSSPSQAKSTPAPTPAPTTAKPSPSAAPIPTLAKPTPAPIPGPTAVKPTPRVEDNEDNDGSNDLLGDYWDGSFGSEDEAGTSNVGAWTPVTLSEDTARVALDAVRYRNNYASGVTTRLCLHRINLIRNRFVNDLVSFLFSVDGCESTKITPTGRCDIYYCKLATYELKVTQKTANKDIYIVQSVFKTLTQKAISELMAPSNLDFNTYNDDDDDTDGGGNRERALAQTLKEIKPQRAAAPETASIQEVKLLLRALRLPLSSQQNSSGVAGSGLVLIGLVAMVVMALVAVVHRQQTQRSTTTHARRQQRARARGRRQPWLHPLQTSSPALVPLSLDEHSGLLVSAASQRNSNNSL